jgi:hypothetical protein
MLNLILSHWLTYVFIVYVLVLAVIVILKRHQPVEITRRPLTDESLSNWRVPQQGALESRQSLLN